jgi:hypothetical protein
MDRRAKKLEKKRQKRDDAKKRSSALAAKKPDALTLLARAAGREEFGPCFISRGWDAPDSPGLVTVMVTRKLQSGHLMPGVALVDLTGIGVKNGFAVEPIPSPELEEFVQRVGIPHGGMLHCEPLVAQSVVFHAIDFARSLGYEPHRDFPAALFGSRPAELLPPPVFTLTDEDEELVHSPLERTVARDGITLQILIYRGRNDPAWVLEVEDHLGGSTVWEGDFETDQAALDAALLAIEEDGVESFIA